MLRIYSTAKTGEESELGPIDSAAMERVELNEDDDKRIRRKTDKVILTILIWVYFLQILDKSMLGYGSIFGLQADTGLVGNQYSFLGSIAPIAQLAWQPFSSVLIVKVPHRILMPALVLGWGIAQASMAACPNYPSLLAARFFLGLFEAGCLPLFSVITNQWYRRSEQPLRVAAWYGTNGLATIIGAAISYGLGHIPSKVLKSWQIIFLFMGLLTIVTAPFVYWKLDNSVFTARFLTHHEKMQAVERLRANQTGIGSSKFEMSHLWELALEPKTYLWISMSLLVNVGAAVTNTFGPLIINGFGFDKYISSLLTMPFGVVQLIVILLASYAAQKSRLKAPILLALVVPVILGSALIYALPRSNQAGLLAGYYLLGFLFGSNPLIVSWIVGNTAGTTKKAIMISLYAAGSSAGNVVGPLLFSASDKPAYHPGLRAVLGIFIALAVIVVLQVVNLVILNRLHSKKRVENGKHAVIHDASMEHHYVAMADEGVGEHAFDDLTDQKNDEFIYIY
ncbi:major facilitator superfamily domain-containing protein [Calycina marina]|uniref:Major facilitator superfamily domain-containing protein n=1 Tax=Calycina marina TaxID=1763456 RepID=A0A9P8CEB7_9HELO|nr:major facilitator superfamily domain-containing protein [Calycina marina]